VRTISVGEYLRRPGVYIQEAVAGNYTTVRLADGRAAVVIDEPEWTMLRQALELCLKHPEWTERLNG